MRRRASKHEVTNHKYEATLEFVKAEALCAAHQLFYDDEIIHRIKMADTRNEVYSALRDGRERL